jgi:hypothetical protein
MKEPGEVAFPEIAAAVAGANGAALGPHTEGNGHATGAPGIGSVAGIAANPFADVDGDLCDADDSWRNQLPTVAQVQNDPHSMWEKSGVAALGQLKASNRPDYERLLDELCSKFSAPRTIREKLDRAVTKASRELEHVAKGDDDSSANTVALMIEHVLGHGRLFCDPMRQAFLDYRDPATGLLATRPVGHPDVRHTLTLAAFDATGRAPSENALAIAVRTLEAQAKRSGDIVPVFPRLGWQGGVLYIDRATPDGSVIRVDPSGFSVIDLASCPVRFLYDVAKGELPVPVSGGSLDPLWDILKLRSERDRKLTLGHLIGSLAPHGPFAGLAIYGLYGSSKTFTMWVLGELIDPSKVEPGTMSDSEHATLIMVQRVWSIRFDNLSRLTDEQSNTLCRLAQGGTFRTRLLYSSSEEIVLQAERPTIANGITEFISRPDLADRYRCITLERIPPGDRKQRQHLRDKFLAVRPEILGVLLDAVVSGLRRTNFTPPSNLPRMADHVVWVSRCELGLGFGAGDYLQAYNDNSVDAARAVVDADALAEQIVAFAAARGGSGWEDNTWKGTATALRNDLEVHAGATASRQPGWPKSPNQLSARLKPLQPALEEVGIEIALGDDLRTNRLRQIILRCDPCRFPPPRKSENIQKGSSPSSPSSPTPEIGGISGPSEDNINDDGRDKGDDPPEDRHLLSAGSSLAAPAEPAENAAKSHRGDDGDDGDDPFGLLPPGKRGEGSPPKVSATDRSTGLSGKRRWSPRAGPRSRLSAGRTLRRGPGLTASLPVWRRPPSAWNCATAKTRRARH